MNLLRITKKPNGTTQHCIQPSWDHGNNLTGQKKLSFNNLCTELELLQNLWSLLGLGLKFCPSPQFTYNKTTKTLKTLREKFIPRTHQSKAEGNDDYNPHRYVTSTWMPQWQKIPNKTPIQINDFDAATKPLFQFCFGRHKIHPHRCCTLCLLQIQEDIPFIKFDKNLEPKI